MFNLKTINTSIHSFKFSIHIAVNNEVCMFISAMVISLPWPWGFTPSFLVQSSAVWEAPTDQVSLSWGRAGPAFCGFCWAEVWVPKGEEVLWLWGLLLAHSPPALAGAWLSGDGLCLILTLILELLGASVDLRSARPVSSGSAVNFRGYLRSGSSSSCVWPYKPPCCCNIWGDDPLLLLLPLYLPFCCCAGNPCVCRRAAAVRFRDALKVSSSCLPGNSSLGQQQAEWLFGVGSESSHPQVLLPFL